MKYLAMIAGGLGPDVWDRELNIEAADWNDANQQAVAQADEQGGQVVSLDQSDDPFPPGHLGDYMVQVRAERDRYRKALERIGEGTSNAMSVRAAHLIASEALYPTKQCPRSTRGNHDQA